MAKLKKIRSGKFTLIHNVIFEDTRLSYKEIGIYCNMMKFPDNWDFSIRYLAECHKDKRDSVRSGIDRLIELGYIVRGEKQHRNENGYYGKFDYIIYEDPTDNPDFIPYLKQKTGSDRVNDDRCTDFPTTDEERCTDFPSTGYPCTDFPYTDNPTTNNTVITNTVSNNTVITKKEDEEDTYRSPRVDMEAVHTKLMNVFLNSYLSKLSQPQHQAEMVDCFNAIVNAIQAIEDPDVIAAIDDCTREEMERLWKNIYFDHFSTENGRIIRSDIRDRLSYLVKYISSQFETTTGSNPLQIFGIAI